jgi:hypothetical protein
VVDRNRDIVFIVAANGWERESSTEDELKINLVHNLLRVQRPHVLGSGHGCGSMGSRFGLKID